MRAMKVETKMLRRMFALSPLLLSACAGAPIERPAEPELPAVWTQAPADAASWAPLMTASLKDLQTRALAANTDIRRAALLLRAAELQARQQGLRVQPTASLSVSANRPLESQGATVNVNGVLVPVGTQAQWSRSYGASVGAGFEFDLWNRLAHLDAQQSALTEASRSDIAAARQAIAAGVAESYWTLASSNDLARLAQMRLELAEQTLPLVDARVREGKLPPLETAKAAAAVQSARQQLAQADAQIARAELSLSQLLDTPFMLPSLMTMTLPNGLPTFAPGDPARVLERRPDVQRARLEVDAALAAARATRAARYPQLNFSAGLGTGGAHSSDWLSQPLLSLASNLAIPLIDWRRLELRDQLSRNELERAALGLRDKVHGALVEIEGLLIDGRRIEAQRAAVDRQLRQVLEAERIAGLKLEVGSIARADELQARLASIEVRQSAEQARLDAVLNRIALLRALAVPLDDGVP